MIGAWHVLELRRNASRQSWNWRYGITALLLVGVLKHSGVALGFGLALSTLSIFFVTAAKSLASKRGLRMLNDQNVGASVTYLTKVRNES